MSTGSFSSSATPSTSAGDAIVSPIAIDLALRHRAKSGLDAAVANLIGQQAADGSWCAELEGDSILQSEYILFKWIIGRENDSRLPKIANYLRRQQLSGGSWRQYPGAMKVDLSATVKGYFALKLMGDDITAPHMTKARQVILDHGGAERANTYSKFYFAALGQLHYDNIPFVPPEIAFLPKFSYFHLDKISAWSRAMIMPLAITSVYRPLRSLREDQSIRELYLNPAYMEKPMMDLDRRLVTWRNIFVAIDKAVKVVDRVKLPRITPMRRRAIKAVEQWILDHSKNTDGLGAIYPPMVYVIIAFRCLGYEFDHPFMIQAQQQLDRFMIEEGDTIRLQPCFSPVWDTGIAAYALTEAGLDQRHPAMKRTSDWMVSKECRKPGDWIANVTQEVEASGWYFEYQNDHYPDVDDTAMVAMALKRIGESKGVEASRRGVSWMLAMQNDDGGWAAFDRTSDRPILEQIPFADHNAIQDPSCPDITGRVLESLAHHGFRIDQPAVKRAVRFIRSRQEAEGCWFGRWGVNYIYGTWQALGGLKAVGVDMTEDWIERAGLWLRSIQKPDGSFGESADTYEDPSLKGTGPSTASQTAWAAMSLMYLYGAEDDSARRAIRWLLDTQLPTGTWDEKWFTGTGFPKVFYLRYHFYRLYFPLMALARFRRLSENS